MKSIEDITAQIVRLNRLWDYMNAELTEAKPETPARSGDAIK